MLHARRVRDAANSNGAGRFAGAAARARRGRHGGRRAIAVALLDSDNSAARSGRRRARAQRPLEQLRGDRHVSRRARLRRLRVRSARLRPRAADGYLGRRRSHGRRCERGRAITAPSSSRRSALRPGREHGRRRAIARTATPPSGMGRRGDAERAGDLGAKRDATVSTHAVECARAQRARPQGIGTYHRAKAVRRSRDDARAARGPARDSKDARRRVVGARGSHGCRDARADRARGARARSLRSTRRNRPARCDVRVAYGVARFPQVAAGALPERLAPPDARPRRRARAGRPGRMVRRARLGPAFRRRLGRAGRAHLRVGWRKLVESC